MLSNKSKPLNYMMINGRKDILKNFLMHFGSVALVMGHKIHHFFLSRLYLSGCIFFKDSVWTGKMHTLVTEIVPQQWLPRKNKKDN